MVTEATPCTFSSTDQAVIDHLQKELVYRERAIRKLELRLMDKTEEITYLKSSLDKYQFIIKSNERSPPEMNTSTKPTRERSKGISGESSGALVRPQISFDSDSAPSRSSSNEGILPIDPVPIFPKSDRSREIIKAAILDNDFLRHLDTQRINDIVECMHLEEYNQGQVIIREGEPGNTLYVLEAGEVEVSRDGEYLHGMSPGQVFGELALLYNCDRTATIKAESGLVRAWALSRQSFQTIMMRSGIMRELEYIEFLKEVPIFANLSPEALAKLSDHVEEMEYRSGDYILRQGARGDTFFIIQRGRVKVTMNQNGQEKFIRALHRGDFFGEKALLGDDLRTANIIADGVKGVTCLVIDKDTFDKMIRGMEEVVSRYDNVDKYRKEIDEEFGPVGYNNLEPVATLGVGGFGRVELVMVVGIGAMRNRSFALKRLKKRDIVETRQEEHVQSEKDIMLEANCQFICKLYKVYEDSVYISLLMEGCLGGELWAVLRDKETFDEHTARFYGACVLEALYYLHSRQIVYRDLKPENVVLDSRGYGKLTDFGFAKRLEGTGGRKTWTFCGTPEYVAPEVILNKGHDTSADLGIGSVYF